MTEETNSQVFTSSNITEAVTQEDWDDFWYNEYIEIKEANKDKNDN